MGKIIYVVILSILSITMLAFILFFRKHKTPYERNMFECFIFALVVMIANIIMALSKIEILSLIAHTLFFVSMTWLSLFFASYCIRYTTEKTGPIPYVFLVFAIADTIHLLVNLYVNYSFIIVPSGDYLIFNYNWPYVFHLVNCYVMIGVGFLYLLIKTIKSPGIYKIKYIYVVITMSIAIVFDSAYLYLDSILNWAVISFVVICIGSYYFITFFVPQKLQSITIGYVASNANAAIIAFDKDNNVIYSNKYFNDYFSIKNLKDINLLINTWRNDKSLADLKEFEENKETDNNQFYRLQYHRFESKKNIYLGSFFMATDITEETERIKEEHFNATHDPLTGVYNRDYFYFKADKLAKINKKVEYTIIVSDVGNFKFMNELFGTEAGDRILKEFGSFLKKYAKDDDVYGRLNSDNFALMMPKKRFNEEFFLNISQQIMNVLDEHEAKYFTCYLGVYDLNEDIPIRSKCDRAALSLKEIKGTTKRINYYKKETSDAILLEQALTGEIDQAILNDEIKLYVQPQTDSNGKILGGECLVRWQHSERGLLPPGIFIPIFERNGKITDIDRVIWEKAASILASWKNTKLSEYYLSVNISPRDLFVLDIPKTFTEIIKKYDINPKLLKLEITESAVLDSVEETERIINELHKAGFTVEMDDFGAGYSSLNTLKDLSFDVIKLDMAFLRTNDNTSKNLKIIESIIDLAKKLELEVITEGVEKKEHVDFLSSVRCNIFQGYYFYKPMPWDDYEKIINE